MEEVIHLTNRDILTQKVFPHMPLSQTYWLDTRRCYNQQKKNSQKLFEIFGSFNDEPANQVRSAMITHIKAERDFYSLVGDQHLKKLKLSIDEWLGLMHSDSVFGDELMLYALARTYQWHVVVFTSKRCWSTVGLDEPITGACLLEICEVHLLYIGQHMYGELNYICLYPSRVWPLQKPQIWVSQYTAMKPC